MIERRKLRKARAGADKNASIATGINDKIRIAFVSLIAPLFERCRTTRRPRHRHHTSGERAAERHAP